MPPFRVLLISGRSPGYSMNFARRLSCEVPEVQILGIALFSSRQSKPTLFSRILNRITDALIGFIHAFPVSSGKSSESERDDLERECRSKQWSFLEVNKIDAEGIARFFRGEQVDLTVMLGSSELLQEFPCASRLGLLGGSVIIQPPLPVGRNLGCQDDRAVDVEIEERSEKAAPTVLIRGSIPFQPFDTLEGQALKADLILNDLLIQATSCFAAGKPAAVKQAVQRWIAEMLPLQNEPSADPTSLLGSSNGHSRIRPVWKLCIYTLILLSPYIVARNWYRRLRGRFPVTIFFHHLVSDRPHRMGVPTAAICKAIAFLQKHYRIVSLSEAVALIRSGGAKVPTVALTFDDGYEENFLTLRAITEAMGIPVTSFLCTDFVEQQSSFLHDYKLGEKSFHAMSWEQARYWQSDMIEFGAHTRTHFDCGSIDRSLLKQEIVGSAEMLARCLGRTPRFFAFPYGKHENMSADAIQIASSTFESSFSAQTENDRQNGNDAKIIGRTDLPVDRWELELALQSVFEIVSHLNFSSTTKETEQSTEKKWDSYL